METRVEMKLISIGVLVGSVVAAPGLGATGQAIDLARSRLVDLTHAYNAQTIYWPTASTRFGLEKLAYGPTPGGYFYSWYSFSTPEHGGTHSTRRCISPSAGVPPIRFRSRS